LPGLPAATTSPAGESARAKVQRVLPTQLAARLDALMSTMDTTARVRPQTPPDAEILLTLADAARRHHGVAIDYTAWRGRTSSRELDPYGLVLHSGRWYVSGWDHARAPLRTFRLDRVGSARATPRSFTPPPEFDAVGHVLAGLAAVPYTHPISVVLDLELAAARRRIPAAVGPLAPVPGGVRLTAR